LNQARLIRHLGNITLLQPVPSFHEVTARVRRISKVLKDLEWESIVEVCNNDLQVPGIQCLWGESEYSNRTNTDVSFDLVVEHFMEAEVSLYSNSSIRK
jgi:hypothetical protein